MNKIEALKLIRWVLMKMGKDDSLKKAMKLYKEYVRKDEDGEV